MTVTASAAKEAATNKEFNYIFNPRCLFMVVTTEFRNIGGGLFLVKATEKGGWATHTIQPQCSGNGELLCKRRQVHTVSKIFLRISTLIALIG